ncbi:hypothetical protein [Rahnella sp. R3(2024)]|uniref:hypothetical protein n=1 Tax=Rahnella sp. R3(2024) TaxID=3163550 RepID=UPI0036ED2204
MRAATAAGGAYQFGTGVGQLIEGDDSWAAAGNMASGALAMSTVVFKPGGTGNATKGTITNSNLVSDATKQLDLYVESLAGSKYKPATSIGAVDPLTGKIVTTSNGAIPTTIAPELQSYADKLGGLGVKTACGNSRTAKIRQSVSRPSRKLMNCVKRISPATRK